jgi:hypothetical protein
VLTAIALVAASTALAGPPPAIRGGTGLQRTILRELSARIEPTAPFRVRIGTAPATQPPGAALWIERARPASAVDFWKEELLVGAFSERSADLKLPPVTWVDYSIGRGNPFGYFGERRSPLKRLTPAEEAALPATIRLAVRNTGARLVSSEVLSAYRDALFLRVRAADPGRFLSLRLYRLLDDLRFYQHDYYDGVFVEVLDGHDRVVYDVSSEHLGSNGSMYRELPRRGYESCFSLNLPRPPPAPGSPKPKPCPLGRR